MKTNNKFVIKSVGELKIHLLEEDKNRSKFVGVEEETYQSFLKWLNNKGIKYNSHINMVSDKIDVYLIGDGFHDELAAGISLGGYPKEEKYYIQETAYEQFLSNGELTPSHFPIKQPMNTRKVIQTITMDMKPSSLEMNS